MEALRETTGGSFHPHVYLLEGTTLIAYIKVGTQQPFYFKKGIKGFDKRGRQFEAVKPNPFKESKSNAITITGSKGQVYTVDPDAKTCSCPGYTYRATCKHVAEHG